MKEPCCSTMRSTRWPHNLTTHPPVDHLSITNGRRVEWIPSDEKAPVGYRMVLTSCDLTFSYETRVKRKLIYDSTSSVVVYESLSLPLSANFLIVCNAGKFDGWSGGTQVLWTGTDVDISFSAISLSLSCKQNFFHHISIYLILLYRCL
jgi:hypothetical protein